jgi:hypothetical protein
MSYGSVTVANLNMWDVDIEPDTNTTSLETAWRYGMEAVVYPQFKMHESRTDLSTLPGTPLYEGDSSWEYRFVNRDPEHQYTNYIVSQRSVQVVTNCEQLEVRGTVIDPDDDRSMYIEGKASGHNWTDYDIPEQASGTITWIASVEAHCGPRCTNFTVLQTNDTDTIKDTSVFLCNSTLSELTKSNGKADITTHTAEDDQAVYGSDNFARIAAGAIGWTGIPWNNWTEKQTRSYTQGSKWSPAQVATTEAVENMLMRFTIGAVGAFDDHGIRYNLTNQRTRPTQGQQLDVDWFWVLVILCSICGIQLLALFLLILFANRTIVRDESFFSMAMLLSPVVERIGRSGMNLSGEEIKQHPKLRWKKIRYDYRGGRVGLLGRIPKIGAWKLGGWRFLLSI